MAYGMPVSRESIGVVEEAFSSGLFAREPHRLYRLLQDTAPVYWSDFLGQWLVTSAEAVDQVLLSPRQFSNFGFDAAYIGRLGDGPGFETLRHHFEQRGLIQADPPDHTRLRRVLSKHFTSRALEPLQGQIEATVSALLSAASDDFDVIRDLAGPLPVIVISDLLGVPAEDRADFPRWSAHAVQFFGTPSPDAHNAEILDQDLVAWRSLLSRLFEESISAPREDLLSIIASNLATGEMSREESLFTCVHLLIAGHETTTNLTGNAMYCLLANPDVHAELVEQPELLDAFIEEVLRFEPPIQRIRRVATEACELAGHSIAAGEPVIPVLAAANRDPQRFSEPDSFNIHRDFTRNPHFSFGRGVHFCIGAPLARLEAPAAVRGLLNRFPNATFADGYQPEWRPTINLRGLASLPIKSSTTKRSA